MRYPNLGYSPLYILIRKLIAKMTKNHTGVPCTRTEMKEYERLSREYNTKAILSFDEQLNESSKVKIPSWLP